MADVECPRCGAMMPTGGVCPLCETPYAVSMASRAAVDDAAQESPLARAWRSGQLALGLAAACQLAAMWLPVMSGVALRQGSEVRLDVSVRPVDLLLGTYPALRGQTTAWLLPGTALFLAQILWSRRTGSAMAASRPLLGPLALAPLVTVVMPLLKLRQHHLNPTPGAAIALVGLASLLCAIAAFRFGDGVPEAAPKRRAPAAHDED